LRAEDAGYTPPENCPVYGDADNVQDALDAICGLQASNVAITPPANCDTLAEVDNVQDALEALCAADNDRNTRLMLRTMMDWGVVCGLRLTANPEKPSIINYTGGTALNREGVLRELAAGFIDLNEATVHGDLQGIQSLAGELCLSLELRDDKGPAFHLSNAAYPYTPSDMTLRERIANCLQGEYRIDDSEVFKEVAQKEDVQIVLNKIMTTWTNRHEIGPVFEVTEKELQLGLDVFEMLREEFKKQTDSTTATRLETLLVEAEKEFKGRIEGAGRNAPSERLRYLVTIYGILARVEKEAQSDCTCDAALPDCAVHSSSKPVLIPIGCIKLVSFEPKNLVMREVCDLCCRKLAHTWQNYRYYHGDQLQDAVRKYEDRCCSYFDDASSLDAFLSGWQPTEEELDPKTGSVFWPPDPGVSNQIDRRGPDLRGVALGKAKEILEKTGVKLNEKFIFEEGEGLFERIREALKKPADRPLGLVFEARAEDVVGLIIDGNNVVDLFVVEASPYYGYNNAKMTEVIIAGGGSSSGAPLDIADVDFKVNTDYKRLHETVSKLVEGSGSGTDEVDGSALPLDTNPAIINLRDSFDTLKAEFREQPAPVDPLPPYDITVDPEFRTVRDELTTEFGALRDQFNAFEVSGVDLDLSKNPSILTLRDALATTTPSTDTAPQDFSVEFGDIWAAIDGIDTPAPARDLAKEPIITDMQTSLAEVRNGIGIDASNLDLSGNTNIRSLQETLTSLPKAVENLGARMRSVENETDSGITVADVLNDRKFTSLSGNITTFEARLDSVENNKLTLNDVVSSQPFQDLRDAVNAAPSGNTGPSLDEILNHTRIRGFRTDINGLLSKHDAQAVLIENQSKQITDQEKQIVTLSAGLKECLQLIRPMTPLAAFAKDVNIAKLREAGIVTVADALATGQDALGGIINKTRAASLIAQIDAFLASEK
jgi:hypothetical protein